MLNKINGIQIRNNSILDAHIQAGGLSEAVLNIDYADVAKAQAILGNKAVIESVTFGQTVAVSASATSMTGVAISGNPVLAADTVTKNAPLEAYKVELRDENGEFLLTASDEVIFGQIDGASSSDGNYVINFVNEAGTGVAVAADATVSLLYYIRTDLWTVSENFAKSASFVDRGIDVTTQLDLDQFVADIFGAGYTLNADGEFSDPFNGTALAGIALKAAIILHQDEIVAARGTSASIDARLDAMDTIISAHTSFVTNIGNATAGQGSALVGYTPVETAFAGTTTVEGILGSIEAAVVELQGKAVVPYSAFKRIETDNVQVDVNTDAFSVSATEVVFTQTFLGQTLQGDEKVQVFYNGQAQIVGTPAQLAAQEVTAAVSISAGTSITVTMGANMTGIISDPDFVSIEVIQVG